jgi:hypothetical protein
MTVGLCSSLETIREESERTKAGCQVIIKHVAICAFISNNASWERRAHLQGLCLGERRTADPSASLGACDFFDFPRFFHAQPDCCFKLPQGRHPEQWTRVGELGEE